MEALFTMLIKWICAAIAPGVLGEIISKVIIIFKGPIVLFAVLISFGVCNIVLSIVPDPPKQMETYQTLPESLKGFVAKGFDDSGVPSKSPFGGVGMEYTNVTAGFKDQAYFNHFKRWHMGLDIVPESNYLSSDEGSRIFGEPLIYATCSGMATSLIDGAGANYIALECNDKKHILLFVHNKVNFISLKTKVLVKAGQPIGVMGSTGNSTGPHVHYSIQDVKTHAFLDPINFIM